MVSVSTDSAILKEDFDEGAVTDNWVVTQVGSGMASAMGGGVLAITTGTTAGDSYTIRTKRPFTLPLRSQFTLQLSQRIANQTFEVRVTNDAGDTVCSFIFDGVTATQAKVRAKHNNIFGTADTLVTVLTSAAMSLYEFDCRVDVVDFNQRPSDTASGGTTLASRGRSSLEPNEQYYMEISAVNGGTAPASSTTFSIDTALMEDTTKVIVDIAGSRGTSSAGKGLPTTIVNVPTVTAGASVNRIGTMGAQGIWYDDTATVLAAGATYTGATRDLGAAATAVAMSAAAAMAQELRISALSDQTGTLYLEVSRDGTTWRRIKAVPTAKSNGDATAVFYAEIIHRPSTRYARAVYVNGATLQTAFQVSTIGMGA